MPIAGTLPTPLIVGLGEAARIAKEDMHLDSVRPVHIEYSKSVLLRDMSAYTRLQAWVIRLGNRLRERIMAQIPDVVLNGDADVRFATMNLHIQ